MQSMRSRADRWAFAALVAMFALLVQALIPAAAMASARADDAFGVICTGSGTAAAAPHAPDQKPKGFAGMPCQDCLAAALAFVQAPELAVQPVAYAITRVEHATAEATVTPRARAPPRPPGQGPPTA